MTHTCKTKRIGFTLIELIVVVSIIGLLTAIALPTAIGLLSAGADAQAYNLLCGHLALARAIAVENGTFAGVHVQMADPVADPNLADTCYIAIVWLNPAGLGDPNTKFTLTDRTTPQAMPGGIAFGGWNIVLEPQYIDRNTGGYRVEANPSDPNISADDFTTFTVLFSPAGSIVTKVRDRNIVFDENEKLFAGDNPNGLPRLWDRSLTSGIPVNNDPNLGESGATIVTLFEYAKFMAAGNADSKNAFLDKNAQYLPINLHTGQPFRRQ